MDPYTKMEGKSHSGKRASSKKMGKAAPVNPNVSSPGVSTDKGRPTANFKGAGANVVGSRGPKGGNYMAGKSK